MALLCPVLVGRDDLLALAERRLTSARDGNGHLLFLAGEAGIGKTRLLGAALRSAARAGACALQAAAFARDTELVGGVLLDLAAGLRGTARYAEIGERMATRLLDAPEDGGDKHRRRRLAVLDLTDLLAGLADDGPVLLALEDLHWADDLSLEVLGQLARRIQSRPMLVIGTYRSDELYPRVPMREWRTRLLTQRLAEEVRLTRLSRAQTRAMIMATLGAPEPDQTSTVDVNAVVVEDVYARSDGIPLHIEEFLAAASVPGQIPQTLSDAVVLRAEQLSPPARAVASAAAVIGRSFDFDLLVDVAETSADEVAQSLHELRERSFVQPGERLGASSSFDFRHALIRDALYDQLSVTVRRDLHARVAHAATARGVRDAVISVHCEAANLLDEAHRRALSGAEQSIRISSHREAFELLRRASRCEPPDAGPVARAELLASLAAEAAAVDDNMTADDAYGRAYGLYRDAGEPVRAAALVAPWTSVRHLLGDDLAARVGRLTAGLELLDEAVHKGESAGRDDEVRQTRRALLAGLSAAYMLDRRLDEAIDYGERTVALAGGTGEDVVDLNAAATLGSVLVFAGRVDDGWPMLEWAVARARRQQFEAEAARAYRMLSTCASVLVEYERAARWLAEGIEYAERVELDNHRHYMMAHLAHVHWATGEWDRASSLAHAALVDGRGGLTTRITAQHVLGYLALGRGDMAAARAHLEEARQHGEQMAELQRLSPALWGLAEVALQSSDVDGAIAWCERGLAASRAVDDAAYLYPFLVTGTRALLQAADPGAAAAWVDRVGEIVRRRSIPGTLPALAHAQGLVDLAAGRTGSAHDLLSHAADGWQERNRFWEGAFCQLDLARCLQRSRRGAAGTAIVAAVRARAASIGAAPLLAAADAIVGAEVENAPWHPLSAREFEVACMVADGLTNREVATRLVLAPKTVSAHVEHILAKLGFARRTEIAAWVATVRAR